MRLIDADALKEHVKKYMSVFAKYDWREICEMLNDAPTVDPVKHGEWRYDEALELEWCSECGFGKRKGDKRWYSYCPNCGCKMEVEDVQKSD